MAGHASRHPAVQSHAYPIERFAHPLAGAGPWGLRAFPVDGGPIGFPVVTVCPGRTVCSPACGSRAMGSASIPSISGAHRASGARCLRLVGGRAHPLAGAGPWGLRARLVDWVHTVHPYVGHMFTRLREPGHGVCERAARLRPQSPFVCHARYSGGGRRRRPDCAPRLRGHGWSI